MALLTGLLHFMTSKVEADRHS